MTMEMAEKQKETENELEGVKKEKSIKENPIDYVITKTMESLSRYVYEKGPIEMANQLCELKIETFNQILINRGELARIMDKEAREEGKSYPPISKSIRLTYQEADRLCRNVVAVIGKMLPGIDGKSKEEEWKTEEKAPRKEIPGFRRMDKTSAQEAADVRICSIDKVVTETMEKMTKEVCQNASAGMANRLYRIKLQTFNEILNKRVEGTKAIDKALREGR
uniref:DUF3232 domain-containing protein n=1 Tax=Caenorhabditis tropicalis TaxID=1561998 RepID=A0A1I7UHD1_9PELO